MLRRMRPRRRPREQRRGAAGGALSQPPSRGLGPGDRHQPHVLFLVREARAAPHDGPAEGEHHQHRVGPGAADAAGYPGVRCGKGRGALLDATARRRVRAPRHPLQRREPGDHSHPRPREQGETSRGFPCGCWRGLSHEARRTAWGDRQGCPVPRIGGRQFRHRGELHGGRRHHGARRLGRCHVKRSAVHAPPVGKQLSQFGFSLCEVLAINGRLTSAHPQLRACAQSPQDRQPQRFT
mmetsp:Transcript_85751/g.262394  ORF Transcript_85751/g.262394 Transcript_85751/m.262394 type:complete len:238 (-) Transcript_85751:85-798(-)